MLARMRINYSWLALLASFAGAAQAADFAWVVLGPGGRAIARTAIEEVGPAVRCPAALADGAPLELKARFRGGPGFPVTICEAALPKGARSASIAGRALPVPRAAPARIVAFGDSGCRVKKGEVQNCENVPGTDPLDRWPLRALAEGAAARKPDLVVHLGDLIYRKAPCPKVDGDRADPRCAGTSAFGTTWATLKAELLEPAAALLAAAPWVMVRGNHESCSPEKEKASQGGVGFFLLFDPRPLEELVGKPEPLQEHLRYLASGGAADADHPPTCAETTPAYVVPAGPDLDLWVLDSNAPSDGKDGPAKTPALVAHFAKQLRALAEASAARGATHAWLLTHRPLYARFAGSRSALPADRSSARPVELNAILQAAFEEAGRPALVDLVLAGHMHIFQAISFPDGARPPTLVAGGGGTMLDRYLAEVPALRDPARLPYAVAGAGEQKVTGMTAQAFGFVWLERGEGGFTRAELRGVDGVPIISCTLRAGEGRRGADCAGAR